MTTINPQMPLLQIYAGGQIYDISNRAMQLSIQTQPTQAMSDDPNLTIIHVEHPVPVGIHILARGENWSVLALYGKPEITDGTGLKHCLSTVDTQQIDFAQLTALSAMTLTSGMNVFHFGEDDRVGLFVPPTQTETLQRGVKICFKSNAVKEKDLHEAWIKKRLADAALPGKVNEHNAAIMAEDLSGHFAKPPKRKGASLIDALISTPDAILFQYNPKTGKILSFQYNPDLILSQSHPNGRIQLRYMSLDQAPKPLFDNYPVAVLIYDMQSGKMTRTAGLTVKHLPKELEKLSDIFNNHVEFYHGFRR